MGRLSVMMLVCLLAWLTECQGGVESGQTQITEHSQEDLAVDAEVENNDNKTFDQGLETSAILTLNTTTDRSRFDSTLYMILKELGALEERQQATVRALEETNRKLKASEKQQADLNNTLTELRRIYEGQRQVAFSAALPVDGTIGPANALYSLVYRHVISNIGGHYSPVTGFFTSPVRGLYYFTFTSFCWGLRDGTCGGSLYHNENRMVSWYTYSQSHPTTGSNSAILLLQVGDKVNVRLWAERRISDNGNKYASFSGFLLFPV